MRKFIDILNEMASVISGEKWYKLDDWSLNDAPYLYHGTSSKLVEEIIASGFSDPSHWGSQSVAEFFARGTCNDHGGKPVIFKMPLSEFSTHAFAPDEQMIDFPIFEDYDWRAEAWEESGQEWLDSLRIYEAVEYHAAQYATEAHILR